MDAANPPWPGGLAFGGPPSAGRPRTAGPSRLSRQGGPGTDVAEGDETAGLRPAVQGPRRRRAPNANGPGQPFPPAIFMLPGKWLGRVPRALPRAAESGVAVEGLATPVEGWTGRRYSWAGCSTCCAIRLTGWWLGRRAARHVEAVARRRRLGESAGKWKGPGGRRGEGSALAAHGGGVAWGYAQRNGPLGGAPPQPPAQAPWGGRVGGRVDSEHRRAWGVAMGVDADERHHLLQAHGDGAGLGQDCDGSRPSGGQAPDQANEGAPGRRRSDSPDASGEGHRPEAGQPASESRGAGSPPAWPGPAHSPQEAGPRRVRSRRVDRRAGPQRRLSELRKPQSSESLGGFESQTPENHGPHPKGLGQAPAVLGWR